MYWIYLLVSIFLQSQSGHLKPVLVEDWWQIAGNPDLADLTSDQQQPVDFGIWQAADESGKYGLVFARPKNLAKPVSFMAGKVRTC
ncbi:MAG: hypothetical protein IPL46_06590 [Saprospiraceae bacterium]|nr:hypothetical protein [Saprospiraceae bacterium]